MKQSWQMLWLLGLIYLAGCEPTTIKSTGENCQIVEHYGGETCVPNQFKRLITLDSVSFANALALGVQPVGTVSTDFSRHLQNYSKDVTNIGQGGEPNLEAVLALNPDLIIGSEYYQSIYKQTQQIAPTLLLEFEHSGRWKEIFRRYGEALDRVAKAEAVMAKYKQRVEALKSAIETEYSQPPTISIIRIYPDGISLYLRDSFPGIILADAGLPRPPSQNLTATEAENTFNNPIQKMISRELIPQADADVIFIWGEFEGDERAREQLKISPLWDQLEAVQNGQVYTVPESYWFFPGAQGLDLLIDDLFKYLVEGKPEISQ